jgi:hypothetical protein
MIKLRGEIILTDAFIRFLILEYAQQAIQHPDCILALDYLRCKEGPRAGEAWLDRLWLPRRSLSAEHIFPVAGLEIYLSPQTQKGLKHHYLDCKDGQPYVG